MQTDKQPTRVCLIDYKNTSFLSPVIDIFNYLFLSTDKRFRDYHAEEMLREYHAALSKIIRQLGSDPDRLFSWQMFQEEMKKFAIFNVLVAPFLLQVSTADAEEVRRNRAALSPGGPTEVNVFKSELRKPLYRERLRDVLRHADEYEFFPVA